MQTATPKPRFACR